MESLSQPVETLALPLAIPVAAYLCDHHVQGRVVLPAVEALQVLAGTLPPDAGADPLRQEGAVFSHLFTVDPRLREIPAVHEVARYADGRCLSRLVTVLSGRDGAWTRRLEHLAVFFPPCGEPGGWEDGPGPDVDKAARDRRSLPESSVPPDGELPGSNEEPAFSVSSQRLYDELVPFGPAYRNVVGDVRLFRSGAWAEVSGGAFPEAVGSLGSPFPLDAALHAACAWGQRYRGIVAFPVGFDRREVLLPTRAGTTYHCHVIPRADENPVVLRFDIRILGDDRRPAEVIQGVAMRDITGGKLKPPDWVRKGP